MLSIAKPEMLYLETIAFKSARPPESKSAAGRNGGKGRVSRVFQAA
jgi:hypothetical protein